MADKSLEELNKQVEKLIKQKQKLTVKTYQRRLKELRDAIAEYYANYEVDGLLTLDELNKFDRIAKVDLLIAAKIKDLYADNNKVTRSLLRDIYTETYKNTIGIAENATGKNIRGILKPINVTKTINEQMAGLAWADRYKKHRTDLIYNIQSAVKNGLNQGLTYKQMSDILKEQMGKDVQKPQTIIRTETKRVQSQAEKDSLDHAQAQGIKMIKTWNTSLDERVRGNKPTDSADHVSMHNQTVPYEEDFTFPDGTKTSAPQLSGIAKHDINCRCFMTIDFVDVKTEKEVDKVARLVDAGMDPKMAEAEVKIQKINPDDYKLLKDNAGEVNEHDIYIQSLPDEIRDSIQSYTANDFADVNRHLRSGMGDSQDIRNSENISKAFTEEVFPLMQNTKIYRHSELNALYFATGKNDDIYESASAILKGTPGKYSLGELKNNLINSTLEFKEFLSTSRKDNVFTKENGLEIEFLMPAGYNKGILVESISNFKTEYEYILDKGQKFVVHDVVGRIDNAKKGSLSDYTNFKIILTPVEE